MSSFNNLSYLPSRSQLAIVNTLEFDEAPDFTLAGENNAVLVGTDRRVFVIPGGRNGEQRMETASYSSLSDAWFGHRRHGGELIVLDPEGVQRLPAISVVGEAATSHAINVLVMLRRRIEESLIAAEEESTPASHSAFAETAHSPIPSAQRGSSLTLGNMLTMSPTEFEEFTGKALESLGYQNVARVGGAGDLGADLTATDPQGRSAIVQCKRYTPGSRVRSPALQSFIGMRAVHHKADRGIFVTTADYTQQAIDLANEHDIVLIDGDDLVKIAALVLTPHGAKATSRAGSGTLYCTDCGESIQPGARFCSSCGTATGP
ncbi:MAG: restriction endonuclease [Chloroflexia bacterium]|nr:restriction endonuclease [Chloroflexia bacterium]